MTDEQIAAQIAALRRERLGYVNRGKRDRVEAVDAALAALGVEPAVEVFPCDCGFDAKSAAGLGAHQRSHEDTEEE